MKKIIFVLFASLLLFPIFRKPVLAATCPCVRYIAAGVALCRPKDNNYCGSGWSCQCEPLVNMVCPANGGCVPVKDTYCPQDGDVHNSICGLEEKDEASAAESCQKQGNTSSPCTLLSGFYDAAAGCFMCCCSNPEPQTPSSPPSTSSPLPLLIPTPCEYSREDSGGPSTTNTTIIHPGIWTALGCFPTDPKDIINWFLKYAIYLAGGIGFLLMLWASIQMMMSGGDPEKLKNAQGMFGSAVIGILIIVFSLFILKFIGATILKIPGWG